MDGANPNVQDLPDHQVMSAQGYGTLPNSALVNGTTPLQQLDLDGEIRQPLLSATLENPALVAGQTQDGNAAGGAKAPKPPPPPPGQMMGYGSTGALVAPTGHDSQAGGQGGTVSASEASAAPPPVIRTDVVGAASPQATAGDGLQGQREQTQVLQGRGAVEAQALTPRVPQQHEAQLQLGAQMHLEGGPKAPPAVIAGQSFFAQGVQWMLQRFADGGGQEVLVTHPSSQAAHTEYQTPVTPRSLFSPEQMRRLAQLEEQAPQLYPQVVGQVGQVASPPSSASLSMEVIQAEVRRQVERELEGRNRRLRELEEENRRLREGNVGNEAYAAPPKVKAKGLSGFLGGLLPGSGGFWVNASRSSPAPPPPPPPHHQSPTLPPPLPPLPTQSAGYGSVANALPLSNASPLSGYPSGLGPTYPSGWQGPVNLQPAEHQTFSGYPSGLVPGVPSASQRLPALPPMHNPNRSGYPSGLVPGVPSGFAVPAQVPLAHDPNPSGYPSGLGPSGVPSGLQAPACEQNAHAQTLSGYPS